MDGPFRSTPRPTAGRVAPRPEPVHRQPEEPQPIAEPPKAVHRVAQHRTVKEEKPLWKRFLWPIVAVVVVLVAAGGWFMWSHMNGGTAIDSSKYQAVFFTNGQVYFGKLQASSGGYMKLTDIYYLQSKQSDSNKDSGNPQATSGDQNNVQLIKLGDEVHGPEDEMVISKDQVLFYENLKPDGKVSQSIQKFKSK